jgi:hypothetical protein
MIQAENVSVRLYPDGRLDSASAATYLGMNEKTLANWRCKGIGPRFVKRGRIFYFKVDLDAWLNEGRAQSTAQARFQSEARA